MTPGLENLRRLLAEATPRPWRVEYDAAGPIARSIGEGNYPLIVLLVNAGDEIAALIEAAPMSGWQDADGPCWCAEAAEVTGRPHIDRCQRMRDTLAALERKLAQT